MVKKRQKSLRGKISLTMIAVVSLSLLCIGALFLFSTDRITTTLTESNQQMSQTSRSRSSSSMTELTKTRLQELADGKAELADRMFYEFEEAVCNAAVAAELLYANADTYPPRDVSLPRVENDGMLALQVLYATGVDPEDEAIQQEVRLLGNLQDTLYAINRNDPSIVSNYIATDSGIMVQADYISAKKFDETGNIMPLDAKVRPWYQGAEETGELFLTPVVEDLHTRRPTVMCGVPIYCNGVFKGVAGAGMYLDNVEALVEDIDLGDSGQACIVNQFGQVLFASDEDEMHTPFYPGRDLHSLEDEALNTLAMMAANHESGVTLLDLNDISRYVACSPMTTTGWSIFVILSQEEVDAPTVHLQEDLDRISREAAAEADRHIKTIQILLPVLLAAALIVSLIVSLLLSRRIINPIVTLTEKVQQVEGDNLDFHWTLETGDETQTLANSFESLTERMKTYITDIQSITAEKERIGTELSLAARIQYAMMPHSFPPFPDIPEFDLYASMDPAREVGGDFYDYFLIDDDHLGLVMADVSGKSVSGALFMMVSKIILQSVAMLGRSPAEILTKTNEAICSNNEAQMFVTVWLGILEISTGRLTAANAGHEYPVLKRADGSFELFKDKHGLVIGAMDGVKYKEYELQLQPGTKFFLYTDGVPEATNADNELFGKDRMLAALNEELDAAPEQILKNVRRSVDAFVKDAEQFDDLTMLCLEYKGNEK